MPLYRDISDLSPWESAFQGALEGREDESETGRLLLDVFEFGRFNMYRAFNASGTAREFAALCETLSRSGVAAPEPLGRTEW
jgi:hypothetical protein